MTSRRRPPACSGCYPTEHAPRRRAAACRSPSATSRARTCATRVRLSTATLRAKLVTNDDLPDARAGRDDDQVARLQTREQRVDVPEPRGQSREGRLTVLDLLQVGHGLVDQLAQGGDLVFLLMTRDVVDPLLGLVGDLLRILRRGVPHLHDVRGGLDQAAKQRRLRDDPRVVPRGRRRGNLVDQLVDVQVAADVLEDRAPFQLLDRGDRVDGIAARVDRAERVEDLARSRDR